MSDEIKMIDTLIERLNSIIEVPQDDVFSADIGQQAKPVTFKMVHKNIRDDREYSAVAIRGDAESLTLVSKSDVMQLMPLEMSVLMEKNMREEIYRIVRGTLRRCRKMPNGGYELFVEIESSRRERIVPEDRLKEAVSVNNPASWAKWCVGLGTGVDLQQADLRGLSLVNFDLAGANLSGADLREANLSGADLSAANLTGAQLDFAQVNGTDFYCARVPSAFTSLVALSGTEEMESIVYV